MSPREHDDPHAPSASATDRRRDHAAERPPGEAGSGGGGQYAVPESELYLRRVIEAIEAAPGIPMSASVRVNRDEVLDLLDEALNRMPAEIRSARWLLKEREEFMARTRREGDELIAEAKARVAQMVQRTEVVKAAEARARQIVEEAEGVSRRMRRETEDFCDQRLASFENVLARVQQSVAAGRQRLAAPTIEQSELGGFDDDRQGGQGHDREG
jgi:cell division septum initiation protein DivIVA